MVFVCRALAFFLFVSIATGHTALAASPPFAVVCSQVLKQEIEFPAPPQFVEGSAEAPVRYPWTFTLTFDGSEARWFISSGVRHLEVLHDNGVLLTMIWRRPIRDGVSVLAYDTSSDRLTHTVVTRWTPEDASSPSEPIASVQLFQCQSTD